MALADIWQVRLMQSDSEFRFDSIFYFDFVRHPLESLLLFIRHLNENSAGVIKMEAIKVNFFFHLKVN